MAVTHWMNGRASETSATVVVRADSTGNVPVVANGVTLQAACDTSVNDGHAVVEFTGLQPGTQYAYTVGGAAGGTLRTFPSGPPYWIALSSCWAISKVDTLAQTLLNPPTFGPQLALWDELRTRLCAVFAAGDLVYMNSTGTVNGVSVTIIDGGTLANAKDVALIRAWFRAAHQHAGRRELFRSLAVFLGKDDHEYDPDNAAYSTAWLLRQFGGSPTAQDLTDVWTARTTAWREWALGNPPREITTGILGGPDYYRVRIGPLEVFVTDEIQERDDIAVADGPAKRMMSDTQEQKLLNDLAGSSASLKCWVSSKQFISSCGRNADGFTNLPGSTSEGYGTQLQRILSDSRFPRSGMFSVTGDEHIKSDLFVEANSLGGAHPPVSQISAGPATIDVITDPEDGLTYRSGVRYKERDTSGGSRRGENSYVLLRVLSDRVERYVLGSRYGLQYAGYIGTADNLVRR